MARKRKLVTIAVSTVGCLLAVWWFTARYFENRVAVLNAVMDGNPSIEQLVGFLDYSDAIILNNTLTRLEFARADAGRERAAVLLRHDNLYVWYCASLYLGAIGDQRSIPYLI